MIYRMGEIQYQSRKYAEKLCMRLAALTPRAIAYWIVIRYSVKAMGPHKAPDEIGIVDVLRAVKE